LLYYLIEGVAVIDAATLKQMPAIEQYLGDDWAESIGYAS
jgi:hypothetical protein